MCDAKIYHQVSIKELMTLTYLEGSSRFWSFISVGRMRVAAGPLANGLGNWPLNSDGMN